MGKRRSVELLCDLLDGIERLGDISKACRAVKIHRMSAHRWMQESRRAKERGDSDSDLRFEYPPGSGEVDWLHSHRRTIEKTVIEDVVQAAVIRARDGIWVNSMKDGQICYQPNPDFEETEETRKIETDADLYVLGYETRWLRDENFKKIPTKIWSPPSSDLTFGILSSYVRRFAKKATVEVSHSGGVLIAAQMPRQVERPNMPMLEVIEPIAAQITDASGVLEPSSEEPEEIIAAEEIAAPETTPVRQVMSELQRDLIARAKEKGLLL